MTDESEPEAAPEPSRPGTEAVSAREEIGPLDLWRYRKSDGRTLLLFGRRDE